MLNSFLDLLKVKFFNTVDFILKREDFELRQLKQLKHNSNNFILQMKDDWNLRARKNPLYFVRTIKDQSEDDFWKSGYIDSDAILKNKSIINNLGKKLDNFKALEIGCGVGRILFPMSEKFQEVVGVDISQEMVNIANEKIKNKYNCTILVNNGKDLSDLSTNHFDFCYSFIVFQHIPDKEIIKNYIKEVSRVLKIGCCFRLQVRGTHEIDSIRMRISGKLNHNTWLGVQFTSKEIHEIAQEYGFDIIEESGECTEYYWLTFLLKEQKT